MADRVSFYQTKDGLEGEITCPLCLKVFKDPKILACGHIYCRDPCLSGLATQGNDEDATCPECRKISHIRNGDIGSFPTAFHIRRLIDLHDSMHEVRLADLSDQETPKHCQTHSGQELAIYCHECEEVLCRDCLIATTTHNGHQYDYIAKAAIRLKKVLNESVEPAKSLQKPLFQALIKIEGTKADILRQQLLIGKDIDTEVDRQVQKLTEKRRNLHSKLSSITTQKTTNVVAREQMLSKTHIELSECICTVEDAVEKLNDLDVVFRMKKLKKQIKQLTVKAEQMPLNPVTSADTYLCTATPDSVALSSKQFYLCSGKQALASKCTFQKEGIRNAWVGQEIRMLIKVCDSKGVDCVDEQTISVELLCLRDVSMSLLSTTCTRPGHYLVQFTPKNRGRHILVIKVNGFHILGSPRDVFIQMPPQKLNVPISLIPRLKHPSGLTCLDGYLLVCENEGDQILMYDKNFHRVKILAKDLNKPNNVAIDRDSNIYVTTTGDNLLHKLDRDGQHLLSTTPNRDQQLEFPHGICVVKSNLVCVCDSQHHKIMVYDTNLNLKSSKSTIGKRGSKPGQFQLPLGITPNDASGEVFIADSDNHRIQVFDKKIFDVKPPSPLTPIRAISEMGNTPGKLQQPISIQTYAEYLYVTDSGNNRVSVFTQTGQFVTTFGEGYLSQPEGITIDQDGFVYVCSHLKQVFVF